MEQLKTSITDGLKTTEEGGLAFTLMNTLLSDLGSMELLDVTQVQGALDGIIEGLDFKAAEGQGANLTQGLADGAAKAIEPSLGPATAEIKKQDA